MTKRKGGRTMRLVHKGVSVIVKENHEGTCVLESDGHQQPTDKKFPQACRTAVTYLLKNAGKIDESVYKRD